MTGGVVLVLGETGRNFAAGMSGGIAYVHDPNSRFSDMANKAMVDLEKPGKDDTADDPQAPVAEPRSVTDNGMGDPLRFDAQRLRILVERHARLTGSGKAKALLADWETALGQFVKVMPRDYRRAMLELRAERAALAVAAQ